MVFEMVADHESLFTAAFGTPIRSLLGVTSFVLLKV
jgi:hypothetical protein